MSAFSLQTQFLVAAASQSQRVKPAFERIIARIVRDTAQGLRLHKWPDRNRMESQPIWNHGLSKDDIAQIVERLRGLTGSA